MVGDLPDIVARLSAVIPKRWFGEQSPVLSALLTSIATPWVWLYNLTNYIISQSRLLTATENWLELIAFDFFGDLYGRKANETDASYRNRIKAAVLRDATTRPSVAAGLSNLTGSQPRIFEPSRCADTGAYGSLSGNSRLSGSGIAYGQAGGWGSLLLPLQCFVTVSRPVVPGVALVAGYCTPSGGYGQGSISYLDLSLLPGFVTDADIQAALTSLLPVNAVAWLRII